MYTADPTQLSLCYSPTTPNILQWWVMKPWNYEPTKNIVYISMLLINNNYVINFEDYIK